MCDDRDDRTGAGPLQHAVHIADLVGLDVFEARLAHEPGEQRSPDLLFEGRSRRLGDENHLIDQTLPLVIERQRSGLKGRVITDLTDGGHEPGRWSKAQLGRARAMRFSRFSHRHVPDYGFVLGGAGAGSAESDGENFSAPLEAQSVFSSPSGVVKKSRITCFAHELAPVGV